MLSIAQESVMVQMFAAAPVYTTTITTLYALFETLQDQIVPEDDAAVTAMVVRLCKAGYAKFLNVLEDCEMACPP
jgi:hypothetical protein